MKTKKEKKEISKYWKLPEVREIYKKKHITEDMCRKHFSDLKIPSKDIEMLIQKIFQPTPQDLEIENY